MKSAIIIILVGILGLVVGLVYGSFATTESNGGYPLDVPEEWPLLSEDMQHPDTLTAFLKQGKVYIRFSNVKNR